MIPGLRFMSILLCALSLSIGWGVRGNWGHEYGAMIPGALSALAVCLASGREDWRRRAAHFAFFGALGWSFGGSMSYGRVQGYTHTASAPDVFYGFAMLAVMGFFWGAMGGAGTALAAQLDRRKLTDFYPPLIAVFAVWFVWDSLGKPFDRDWFDTDWLGVLLLMAAAGASCAIRRRVTEADKLIFAMAGGWWAGFLVLVAGLGLRMTPPRGDNLAGCLGMTAAMLVVLYRQKQPAVAWVSLVTGFASALGFAAGNFVRVAGFSTGIAANWHSVFEQSYGFISGVGVALAMGWLSARSAPVEDGPGIRDWAEPFAVGFVLIAVTYVNIVKNIRAVWLPSKGIPEAMYGLPAAWWFHFAYLALAATVVALLLRHVRRPVAALPASPLGKGQVLYVVFLWWIVIGNLSRYLPFHPQRLVTEGVIHLNACLASALVLMAPRLEEPVPALATPDYRRLAWRTVLAGSLVTVLLVALVSGVILMLLDGPLGGARYRFGPRALEP